MRAELGLPSVKGDDEHGGGMTGGFGGSMGGATGSGSKSKRPINVKFEIPYFTTSGIPVRYLKIIEPKVSPISEHFLFAFRFWSLPHTFQVCVVRRARKNSPSANRCYSRNLPNIVEVGQPTRGRIATARIPERLASGYADTTNLTGTTSLGCRSQTTNLHGADTFAWTEVRVSAAVCRPYGGSARFGSQADSWRRLI